jgi:hypothetical protein
MEIAPELKYAKDYVDALPHAEMSRMVKIYKISNLNPRIGLKWTYLDFWSTINDIEYK